MKGWIPAGTTAVKLKVLEERVGTFCGSLVTQNGHRVKQYFLVSFSVKLDLTTIHQFMGEVSIWRRNSVDDSVVFIKCAINVSS